LLCSRSSSSELRWRAQTAYSHQIDRHGGFCSQPGSALHGAEKAARIAGASGRIDGRRLREWRRWTRWTRVDALDDYDQVGAEVQDRCAVSQEQCDAMDAGATGQLGECGAEAARMANAAHSPVATNKHGRPSARIAARLHKSSQSDRHCRIVRMDRQSWATTRMTGRTCTRRGCEWRHTSECLRLV
jgi:hypothetical protein